MDPRESTDEERGHLRSAPGFRARWEWPPRDRAFFLGIAEGTFSLYVAPEDAFHFDLEGRLRRATTGGAHYLRGLDGAVLRKTTSRGPGPAEGGEPLSPEEALRVFRTAHGAVSDALASFRASLPDGAADGSAAEARELLDRAAGFDPPRLAAEARRFREVYEPLGILPPDRYRAVILQATFGCSYGRCAFCSLYGSTVHRARSPAEFLDHVRKVKAFLGRALELRSGVFLGEANALEVPARDLEAMLQMVRVELPGPLARGPGRRGGFSAFTDVFHGDFKTVPELERLCSLGMDRVYLGIESGDEGVLRRLRKPVTRERAIERVRILKEGGISVGAIFLAGAGGRGAARAHVEGTVSLVRDLPLDGRDVVYVSPLRLEEPGGDAALVGGALSSAELQAEEQELLARVRSLGLRASRYDLRSFVYY